MSFAKFFSLMGTDKTLEAESLAQKGGFTTNRTQAINYKVHKEAMLLA